MKRLLKIEVAAYWWTLGAWYYHKGDNYFTFSLGRLQIMIGKKH